MLFLNQFFHPSSAATSQLLTDLATHLSATGHPVTVIHGRPDYSASNQTPLPNINTIQIPNLPFAHTKIGRVLSYASFYICALCLALTTRRPGPIVTLTTPPLLPAI